MLGADATRELESELVNAAEVNPEVRGQRGYRASGSSVSIIGRRSFLSVSRLFSPHKVFDKLSLTGLRKSAPKTISSHPGVI